MSTGLPIERTSATWNFLVGCTPISSGGTVRMLEEKLMIPLKWKKPRRIFVNPLGDLFYKDVRFEIIDRVFAVMALCPQHTFQILTKQPERMAEYLDRVRKEGDDNPWKEGRIGEGKWIAMQIASWVDSYGYYPWPLPNVWLGTSVEDRESADKRIPHLLRCPAAMLFLSAERLPVEIDFSKWIRQKGRKNDRVAK